MTSRERVLLAINHQEPDRLPVFKPNTINTYDPFDHRVQTFMDTFEFDAIAGVGGLSDSPSIQRELPDGTREDGYGCRFKYEGVGLPYCIYSPLADAASVDDVERFDWPDPMAGELDADGLRQRVCELRNRGQFALGSGVEMLFHRYHYLRGFEQWMIDIKLNPEIHRAIADHVQRINITRAMRVLEVIGDQIDVVSTGDDLGTSIASYMSPGDFRELVKPYYKDLIGRIKERFPHIKFYLHSHGQIMDLVPDLIDCGVDILNPILPLDNMDPVRLKHDFGDRLAFQGGIDIEKILVFGSVADVETHVKEAIDILTPGGGFLFKAQAISPLIPPGNVLKAYEIALDYWPRK